MSWHQWISRQHLMTPWRRTQCSGCRVLACAPRCRHHLSSRRTESDDVDAADDVDDESEDFESDDFESADEDLEEPD